MAEEIDPAVLKKTQDILGSVIKRPPLTEKNLKRPPFRFLHDIITNVVKTTSFLKGLYTSEEMVSENIKDKETKIVFLQKAVDALSLINNQTINLKPSKVVAGHEVQKTNEFLQILGTSVKKKLDYKEAVHTVLAKSSNSTSSQRERRASVEKRPNPKINVPPKIGKLLLPIAKNPILLSRDSRKNASEKTRSSTKTNDAGKKSDASKSRDPEKKRSRSKEPRTKDKEKSKEKSRSKRDDSKNRTKSESKKEKSSKRDEVVADESPSPTKRIPDPEPVEESLIPNGHVDEEVIPVETEVPRYAVDPDSQMVNGESLMDANLPLDQLNDTRIGEMNELMSPRKETVPAPRVPSGHRSRPPSARSKRTRPGTATEEAKNEVIPTPSNESSTNLRPMDIFNHVPGSPLARPPSARPSSSRPAPPRIRIRHIVENDEPSTRPPTAKPAVENVIIDQGQQSEEEEEEEFFVAEEPVNELKIPETPVMTSEPTPDEDKGSLVKQLLETKKDLEGGSQQIKKTTEIDMSQMSTATTQRAREASNKELEQLRLSIQTVSKSANPLGRMLDYLQEDVDSMKTELKRWKEEHRQNLAALRKEKNITESTLEPLRVQLDDLDQVVQDQIDANSAIKASILKNDERIQRMIGGLCQRRT